MTITSRTTTTFNHTIITHTTTRHDTPSHRPQATFLYIRHNNLYVVAASKKNANAALVFVFLHRLVQVRAV